MAPVDAAITASCRTLHWVTKIGSLSASLRFYQLVFGFRVLRHEEFESGCEATCNGPYGGAWSKTMVGWGPEASNFAFELTYNYGIDSYQSGNDLQYFAISCPEAVPRAVALGYKVEYELGVPVIHGPDSFRYKIFPEVQGRSERFLAVALKVKSIATTLKYWRDTLGMQSFAAPSGIEITAPSATLGWKEDQTKLLFMETDGAPVDHSLASGRIANACSKVVPFHDAAVASGLGSIMNPLITLPTPGKADVVVTILADPDGYEICFVGDVAFYQLAEPLWDVVDWKLRASRGADGAPPPKAEKMEAAPGMSEVTTVAEVEALGEGGAKVVVLDFGAGWCKKCKGIKPFVESLTAKYTDKAAFALVDIDEAVDLCDVHGVSSVPHFIFLRDGMKIGSYVGSTEADLEAGLVQALESCKAD